MKIKSNKIISFLMIMGFSCVGMAQMETQFTQYMNNRLSFNPGYAGSSGSICASVMYRNQWLGLQLDPPTPDYEAGTPPVDYLFSFDMPVKFLHGGIGLTLFQDNIGYNSCFYGALDYAFRIYWGPGNLAAGIEANIFNCSLDFQQLVGCSDFTGNYLNPVQSSGDPSLGGQMAEDFLFDISTGLYYQVPGSYYLGLSIKDILAAKSSVLNRQNARVLFLTAGYEYNIPANPSFQLRPSFLLKTASFRTTQLDLSCILSYQSTIWGGVSYRYQDAISVIAGLNWNHMQMGFSYDLTTSQVGGFKDGRSVGSLEAYVKYCFKVIIPPKLPSSYRGTLYLF